LGIVAQEMREYAQALDFYQQALAIKIEFGDRYRYLNADKMFLHSY
jgi:hypothetical protein